MRHVCSRAADACLSPGSHLKGGAEVEARANAASALVRLWAELHWGV